MLLVCNILAQNAVLNAVRYPDIGAIIVSNYSSATLNYSDLNATYQIIATNLSVYSGSSLVPYNRIDESTYPQIQITFNISNFALYYGS